MNLRVRLEASQSKLNTTAIVNYVGNDASRFKELMDLFLAGDYRIRQHAAWPLSYCCIAEPSLVKPYFKKLLVMLDEPGHHPAIKRNILRMFQEIEIPEKYQSPLIDICFKIIPDPNQAVASVAFAVSTATKLCKPYPELVAELCLLLEQLLAYPQKPAITVRIKKSLKTLI